MGENKKSIFNIGSPDIDIKKKNFLLLIMLRKDIQLILTDMEFYFGIL